MPNSLTSDEDISLVIKNIMPPELVPEMKEMDVLEYRFSNTSEAYHQAIDRLNADLRSYEGRTKFAPEDLFHVGVLAGEIMHNSYRLSEGSSISGKPGEQVVATLCVAPNYLKFSCISDSVVDVEKIAGAIAAEEKRIAEMNSLSREEVNARLSEFNHTSGRGLFMVKQGADTFYLYDAYDGKFEFAFIKIPEAVKQTTSEQPTS